MNTVLVWQTVVLDRNNLTNWIRFFDHPRHGLIPCTRATRYTERLNYCKRFSVDLNVQVCLKALSNNIKQEYLAYTVITVPQRHSSWRRAVPSLRLWPQELSFLVQVCFFFYLRTWTHKLTVPFNHIQFQSQGFSGRFSGAKPRPHWRGSCQPWENGGNWIYLEYNLSSIFKSDQILTVEIIFSKQEEEKRPFYNELSFGLSTDCDVKTKGWTKINISQ